jgi:chemotaxis signal transduction protein
MVIDEHIEQQHVEQPSDRLWCYLMSLRGELYAIPDETHTVLLPHISHLPPVTPLPLGLVPSYVLGLANINQRGEVVIDLAAFLCLSGEQGAEEQRRLLVIGEMATHPLFAQPAQEPYRLAFVVDNGYELIQLETLGHSSEARSFVRELITTPRGQATLLDMEAICRAVLNDLGAERPWNAVMRSVVEE